MRIKTLIASGATTALLLTPAWALAAGSAPSDPGASHPNAQSNPGVVHQLSGSPSAADHPDGDSHPSGSDNPGTTPGPHASAKAKRKAYGTYCAKESRKHVARQHGTPFSQCVTAMAKAATGKAKNPTSACKGLSKKHVAGQHGTPFSQCVSAATKLLQDQQQSTDDSAGDDSSSTADDATSTTA